MAQIKVFAVGVTGYIGGSALHAIFQAHPNLTISALVRSDKDDHAVSSAFGNARIVRGSFTDLDLLEEEASRADAVLNFADADDLNVVKALLKGAEKRYARDDKKMIYLHTSGAAQIQEGGDGTFVDAPFTNDANVDEIKAIDAKRPHRNVDLYIFKANDAGYVDAYIVSPAAIHGKGTGPVRTITAQLPALIRVAVQRQQAVMVGPGENVWNFVHIEDLADLYALVFDLALSGKDKNSAYGRYYFGSSTEMLEWKTVVQKAAGILKARGKIPSDNVKSVQIEDDPEQLQSLWHTATMSRSIADRGFALGWKPHHPGGLETVEATVDQVIESEML